MAIFGLGAKTKAKPSTKSKSKTTSKKGKQSNEAKAVLAKMKAKKDAGDCAFC